MNLILTSQRLAALLALGSIILVPSAWSATPAETIKDLIPKLAAPNVPDRYAAQMELQQLASTASKPGAGAARVELGKLLAAQAADTAVSQPVRVWIIRQLEYMGGAEAVSALNQMLSDNDAEVRECARRALEKNPAPDATVSLRAALQKGGDTTWKIGLINSLGQRRDPEATALILPFMGDAQTVEAAALALGKIATPQAVEALWKDVDQNAIRAIALVNAANQLAAEGKAMQAVAISNDSMSVAAGHVKQAKAIYQKLYAQSTLAASARAAALTGLARVDASAAAPLVSQALSGTEAALQNAAAIAAPIALGKDCSRTLAALLPSLAPRAKILVLNIMDAAGESAVVAATKDADGGVRLAALEAMGRIGGSPSVPALLTLTASDIKAEKTAAEAALTKLRGAGADAAIQQAAGAGESAARVAAINALAARNQVAAMPTLLKCAGDADAPVRKAAFAAAGRLAGDADMDALIKLASGANAGEAFPAIEAAATRVQDKPAAAKKLLAIARDEATQTALLGAWSALGGTEPLGVVVKLTASPKAEIRERAIKTLGNWPDFTASKPLLALAADAATPDDLHTQTLQALVRLVNASDTEPADSLAEAALAAMSATRKDDEKKLVLSVLGAVPHPKSVATIKSLLGDPKLKAEAGQAGIALAELLGKTDKPAAKELAQAIKEADISADITRRANRILNRN